MSNSLPMLPISSHRPIFYTRPALLDKPAMAPGEFKPIRLEPLVGPILSPLLKGWPSPGIVDARKGVYDTTIS